MLKNILFKVDNPVEHNCGECVFYKTKRCTFDGVDKASRVCPDFFKMEQKKKEIKITFVAENDTEFSIGMESHLLTPAGGFTKEFAYEGFWLPTKTGGWAWVILWDNGKERGLQTLGQDGHWYKKVQIGDTFWRIVNQPTLRAETSWTAESAYKYRKTGETVKTEEAYKLVEDIIKYFVDLDYGTDSTEGKYVYAACWTIATYFYELFPMFPYALNIGYKESGKTTLAEAMVYQSYHGRNKMVDPSVASLFRIIETCKPTMFFDNAERFFQHNNMDEESRKIVEMLAVGAYADAKVCRTEGEGSKRQVIEYAVYSPKTITTIVGVTASLESRSIMTTMIKTDKPEYSQRRIELKINPFDETDAKAIRIRENRNMLYGLRMKMWMQVQQQAKTISNKKYGIMDRDWEAWRPLIVIAELFCPDKVRKLLTFTKECVSLNKEAIIDEEKEMAIEALTKMWTGKDEWIDVGTFTESLLALKQGNMGTLKANVSGEQASKTLRSLGFIKRRKSNGIRQFFLDGWLLKKLCETVNLEMKATTDTPKNEGEGIEKWGQPKA